MLNHNRQPPNTSPHSRPDSIHIPSPEPFVDTNFPTAETTPQHPPSLLSPVNEGPTAESFPTTATAERLQVFSSYQLSAFSEETSWPEFSAQCVAFTTQCVELSKEVTNTSQRHPAPCRPERPSARPPIDSHRPERFNWVEARHIQGLYKHSQKRAIHKVFNDNSPVFTGTTAEAQSFFTDIFGPKNCNTTCLVEVLFTYVPTTDTDDSLFAMPSAAEINAKLRAMANSAPGKDRVEYQHLRLLDPKGEILHLIYDRCFQQKDVPSLWKTATTILIHKKGSTNDGSNFRPIALVSCVYKLMMAILSKRMNTFAIDNDLLLAEQKRPRPNEVCYEHGYILQSIIVYTGATTKVRTDAGLTDTILIHTGVKQGCPLSPILFNLALELVLRKIKAAATTNRRGPAKHHNIHISVLAYADDLVLITRDKANLQTVVHALKMLSSSDPLVAGIARHELHQTVRHAAKADPTPALVSNYLSASPDRRLENIPHRVQSLWSRTRKACRNLHVTIKIPLAAPAHISTAEYVHLVLAPDECRFLHNITKEQFAAKLTELPDQGRGGKKERTCHQSQKRLLIILSRFTGHHCFCPYQSGQSAACRKRVSGVSC